MPTHSSPTDFGPSTQQLDSELTRDALPTGTRLGGYQIIEVLGRGGFGIVYLALDSSLQRQVAIKEYFPAELAMRCEDNQVWVKPGVDVNAYASGKEAFLTEAKMLARFDHPSLARVHTFWEENRSAYMVMPYYEGLTLTATLAAMPRPPDEAWLRELLTPLLGALTTLHMAQCLHLDISPDNIIVLADGRPVLLDFGVANRLATDKTLPLTALLNPAYAPIEQYSESAALQQGPWTDLYALAGVLHFAITGQPPARATVRAVEDPQRSLPEAVRTLNQRYPGLHYSPSFLYGIDKALSVKPRERPRDVAEFQQWLDRPPLASQAAPHATKAGARSEPLLNTPPPRNTWVAGDPPLHARSAARSRTPLKVAGLLTLIVAGVAAWGWLHTHPQLAKDLAAFLLPTEVTAREPNRGVTGASGVVSPAPAATVASPTPLPLAVENIPPAATTASAAPLPQAPAEPPAPAAETAAAATTPAAPATPTPPPQAEPSQTKVAQPEAIAPPLPTTPRAACGSRENFSLVYCLQAQCRLSRFAQHPQCVDLRQRGEIK